MSKMLIFAALLLILSITNAAVYELHLVIYKNDSVELKDLNVTLGSPGPFPDAGNDNNYEFRIMAKDNGVLFNQSFHLGFVAYRFRGPDSTEPDVVPYNKTDNYWRLPYFDNASRIQLFHENRLIFEYAIPEKQETESTNAAPNAQGGGGIDIYLVFSYAFALLVVAFIIYKTLSKPAKGGGQA
ncbi:MAG: hypothetical protein NTY68_03930 [Candidatus Micrarchaeota archaeon]|nr:hypothetical protein [Candidatus Micrarchaeota archaeon]